MLKYLLPFGKTTTGILLNVAIYSILLFIVIFFPIYFTKNDNSSNNYEQPIATTGTTIRPTLGLYNPANWPNGIVPTGTDPRQTQRLSSVDFHQ